MDEPRIIIAGLSVVGKVRHNQEDSWAVWEGSTGPDRRRLGRLLIVADGIGGSQAGEVASALAVETVREEYLQGDGLPQSRLRAAVREANNKILEEAEERPECRGMGTTVVAAAIVGDQLTVAWVGDSRAYLLRGKELLQITRDHSGAARGGSRGGAGLSRSLGSSMTVDPDIRQIILQPGDRIILCSDGLYNLVAKDEIVRLGRSAVERWANELVQAALRGGAPDNVTVVAAHIERLPFAPHRHPEIARGETLDGLRLEEQIGADRFYLWYRAERGGTQRLLCILRPELQADNELLLEIEEDEESLGRTLSPHLAGVEGSDLEKSLAYVCLRLPWHERDDSTLAGSSELHSLEEALPILSSIGSVDVVRSLRIALQVAEGLTVVRDSMLPSGAPYLSDFWGDGEQYVLCRWPGERRQYCVSTSKGVQADPYLLAYMPPDYTPEDVPGSASDAYFVGVLLQRLLGGRDDQPPLPAPVQQLLEDLLAERAGQRPDAPIAIRNALQDTAE